MAASARATSLCSADTWDAAVCVSKAVRASFLSTCRGDVEAAGVQTAGTALRATAWHGLHKAWQHASTEIEAACKHRDRGSMFEIEAASKHASIHALLRQVPCGKGVGRREAEDAPRLAALLHHSLVRVARRMEEDAIYRACCLAPLLA